MLFGGYRATRPQNHWGTPCPPVSYFLPRGNFFKYAIDQRMSSTKIYLFFILSSRSIETQDYVLLQSTVTNKTLVWIYFSKLWRLIVNGRVSRANVDDYRLVHEQKVINTTIWLLKALPRPCSAMGKSGGRWEPVN